MLKRKEGMTIRQVQRAGRLHGVFWVTVGCLTLLMVLWAWLCFESALSFPVTRVKIEADYAHVSRETIKKAVLPLVHTGFFGLDVNAIKERLQTIPWIAEASVSRLWPDTVVIRLLAQQPTAVWNETGIFNEQGNVFSLGNGHAPKLLPHLYGPEGTEDLVWQKFSEMNAIVRHLGLSITGVHLSERHAWQIQLNNGMRLYLGRGDIQPRLQRFVSVYEHVFGSRGSEVMLVDLRYANGMAVQWRYAEHRREKNRNA